jgi:hypothetical protein
MIDELVPVEKVEPAKEVAPSRKDIKREIRKKKMLEKAKRKAKVQKKAERKLAIKSERVKINKRENAKKKLVKKIQAREEKGLKTTSSIQKPAKKVFVKDNFGIPQKK